MSDTTTEFEMTDLQVPVVKEDNDFESSTSTLSPSCELSENYELKHDIKPRTYEPTRDYILNRFGSGYETYALGIEEWTQTNSNVNITINVFFQQVILLKCINNFI